jgi:hypothetical protein
MGQPFDQYRGAGDKNPLPSLTLGGTYMRVLGLVFLIVGVILIYSGIVGKSWKEALALPTLKGIEP